MIVSLSTYENGGYVRSGYLSGIFGCFAAQREAPGVMDGCDTTPGGGRGRTNLGNLTGDRFQVIDPFFTYENGG